MNIFKGVLAGCSSHDCIVNDNRKGMHSNGSCKCLINASRSQLSMITNRVNQNRNNDTKFLLIEALDALLDGINSTPELSLSSWGIDTDDAVKALAKARGETK